MATELENGKILCEQCGGEFKQIGNHWIQSKDCSHPELSNRKKDILIGLLMGDGWVDGKNSKNQLVRTDMISPNYLEYVDNKLEWLSTGVNFHQSAEESAKMCKRSGFDKNAKAENYSDQYRLQTRSHPFITSLTEWYSSGSKVWPEDIELTPTVLKHWYCGDGTYRNNGSRDYIQIGISNEVENTEKVSSYFRNVGLPEPSNYSIYEEDSSKTCNAEWTVKSSKKLFDYMGEPLPDFTYKWPKDMR